MLISLALALFGTGDGQRIVASDDALRLVSKDTDGFPEISVVEADGKKDRVLYRTRNEGLFVNYAFPWAIWSSKKSFRGFFVAWSYSTGSRNRLTVVGPQKDGEWGEVLRAEADGAYWKPPEVVDLVGDGIADVIVVTESSRVPLDFGKSKVEVWRWSWKAGRYRLAAKTDYRRRLGVGKRRD